MEISEKSHYENEQPATEKSNPISCLRSFFILGLALVFSGCKNEKWNIFDMRSFGEDPNVFCDSDYHVVFPNDTCISSPLFLSMTEPESCYSGLIETDDEIEADMWMDIFFDPDTGELKLGVCDGYVNGHYLNGGEGFDNYFFCSDGTLVGEVDSYGFDFLLIGGFRDARDSECFCYCDNCGNGMELDYSGNQIFDGYMFEADYDSDESLGSQIDRNISDGNLLIEFTAHRDDYGS